MILVKIILLKQKKFLILNRISKSLITKKGIGGAINLGIKKALDQKFIMMADLSDDIHDLKKYNSLMDEKNLDAVLGSRF